MKSKSLSIITSLTLTFVTNVFSQGILPPPIEQAGLKEAKHPKYACLWEITGKDLKKPSYLFGTVHVSDSRITTLHPKAQTAFDAADQVYGELELTPEEMIKASTFMIRKDGKTVSEHIGPERTAKINAILGEINPALSLAAGMDGLETWAIATQISQIEEQMKGGSPLDMQLLEKAKNAGKGTAGLETIERQIGVFSQLNSPQQLSLVDMTLEFMAAEKRENRKIIDEIKALYILQKPKAIGDYLKKAISMKPTHREQTKEEKELTKWFLTELLDKRNNEMSVKIDEILEAKSGHSHFFAVGAAHYTGATAIQDQLKKTGYTIKPLFQ